MVFFFFLLTNLYFRVLPLLSNIIKDELNLRQTLFQRYPQLYVASENHDLNDFAYVSTVSNQYCYLSRVVNAKTQSIYTMDEFLSLGIRSNVADFTYVIRIPDKILQSIIQQTEVSNEQSDLWRSKYLAHMKENPKPKLDTLRDLLFESRQFMADIPESVRLEKFVQQADQWVSQAQLLLREFVPPSEDYRNSHRIESRLNWFQRLEFLEQLANGLHDLPFQCAETTQLEYWASELHKFLDRVEASALDCIDGSVSESYYGEIMKGGARLGFPLHSLERLIKVEAWLARVNCSQKSETIKSKLKSKALIYSLYEDGVDLSIPLPSPPTLASFTDSAENQENIGDKIEQEYSLSEKKSSMETSSSRAESTPATTPVPEISLEYSSVPETKSIEEAEPMAKPSPVGLLPKSATFLRADLTSTRCIPISNEIDEDMPASQVAESIEKKCKSSSIHNRPFYGEVSRILTDIKTSGADVSLTKIERFLSTVDGWYSKGKQLFGIDAVYPMSIFIPAIESYCSDSFSLQDTYQASLESPTTHVCFCRTVATDSMVQCWTCKEHYHIDCLYDRGYIEEGCKLSDNDFSCPVCEISASEDSDPVFQRMRVSGFEINFTRGKLTRPTSDDFEQWARRTNRLPIQPDEFASVTTAVHYLEKYQKYLQEVVFIGIDGGQVSIGEIRFHLRKVEGGIILLDSERTILIDAIEEMKLRDEDVTMNTAESEEDNLEREPEPESEVETKVASADLKQDQEMDEPEDKPVTARQKSRSQSTADGSHVASTNGSARVENGSVDKAATPEKQEPAAQPPDDTQPDATEPTEQPTAPPPTESDSTDQASEASVSSSPTTVIPQKRKLETEPEDVQ